MDILKRNLKASLAILASLLIMSGTIALALGNVAFASSSNTVTANVAVEGVCYISLSPNAISFGSLYPTATHADNVLVTDSDPYGNVAANVLVSGTDWASSTYNFGVSNTTWSATSSNTFLTTTQLTNSPVPTGISIPAPSPTVSNGITSNSIYFGLSVPGAIPAGTYTQRITITNSC
ncbi:hypothetical protein Micr_00920 [Candidatus Micrarchaeum sp.]|uniref:hypothetical protein n=1 Tax=Candidatus Micrarchaeum sp. TaxID=2282148 RepID=UPI001932FFD8|nr:hypothetical protein [Candidatus Micrarchaeum sp.]QRF74384.1 hypothetical protein Micr_00920 [Candidatus Micrarchaeum sp.]